MMRSKRVIKLPSAQTPERLQYMKALNAKHRDEYRAKRYGLRVEDIENKISEQEGRCAICGRLEETLHVDHDHTSGKFRAMLCAACNKGLGFFGDSIELLQLAARYLQQYK